ncbi:hypothetical protein UFOVP509_2 [uncultured Caudovirales phage]|uniref:Uncharacterized protein n=1 Tax=uncultured Caudovirales phage TaxID=2100421 RepID=A0A6J5MTJ5_9CAUD|nr:hypothetical protein UFOVP509_2 [uncultured Caudovirales phage]
MDGQTVVIVGKDGTEHEFPAGFDPKRAAAIVRGQSVDVPRATQPTKPGDVPVRRVTQPRGTQLDVRKFSEAVASGLPAIASTAAALETGGLSIPMQLGAQGLAGIVSGAARGGGVEGMTKDAATNMLMHGVVGGVMNRVRALGPSVSNMGRRFMTGLLKIKDATAKSTNAFRQTQDLMAGKREITEKLLKEKAHVLGQESLDKLDNIVDSGETALGDVIAGSKATIDPRRPVKAAAATVKDIRAGAGSDPQANAALSVVKEQQRKWMEPVKRTVWKKLGPAGEFDPKTGRHLFQATSKSATPVVIENGVPVPVKTPLTSMRSNSVMRRGWRDVPIQEAQKVKVATAKNLSFADGADTGGDRARKAIWAELRDQIVEAAPEAKAINAGLSKAYPARQAMMEASSRTGNYSPVTMGQQFVTLSPRKALTGAAAALNSPRIGSKIAGGLYNLGGRMATASELPAQITAQALRAAIMASMRHDNK